MSLNIFGMILDLDFPEEEYQVASSLKRLMLIWLNEMGSDGKGLLDYARICYRLQWTPELTRKVLMNLYGDNLITNYEDGSLYEITIPLDQLRRLDPQPAFEIPNGRNAGYVYVVESGGRFKIGISENPKTRIQALRTGSPYGIHEIALIKTTRYRELESELHTLFADRRMKGEWFALTPADVAYLKGLQS